MKSPLPTCETPLDIAGRHVIDDDTSVLGGVLLTRAGIVVDVAENPTPYQEVVEVVDQALAKRLKWTGEIEPINVFDALYGAVNSYFMPFNTTAYERLLKGTAEARGLTMLRPTDAVGLSEFIGVGGICHQQTLLNAAVLELMKIRGDLAADTRITVCSDKELGPEFVDRHTRVSIDMPSGDSFIIDRPGGALALRPRT